jgi:SM-20-related protein
MLLQKIEAFVQYLNQTCYAGINDHEFHHACYAKNTFYKRHLDQFKSNSGRKYSLVIYLNKDWKATDGGKLILFLKNDKTREILPEAGRAVFFKSNEIEHEVSPSINRSRISIAGWLKSA